MPYEFKERFGEFHILERSGLKVRRLAIADKKTHAEVICAALNLVEELEDKEIAMISNALKEKDANGQDKHRVDGRELEPNQSKKRGRPPRVAL